MVVAFSFMFQLTLSYPLYERMSMASEAIGSMVFAHFSSRLWSPAEPWKVKQSKVRWRLELMESQ